MSILDGFISLAKNLNKVSPDVLEKEEGIVSERLPELSLDKEDKELISLKNKWEERWLKSKAYALVEPKQAENEKYWLGDHATPAQKKANKRQAVDNLVFGSLETALPVYTRQIAEPVITSDKTPEGIVLTRKVSDRLVDIADTLRLRLKIKKAVRHWTLYYLGIAKIGWSIQKNEIAVQIIRPQQMILDPDAITDECEYEGEYLGQYRT